MLKMLDVWPQHVQKTKTESGYKNISINHTIEITLSHTQEQPLRNRAVEPNLALQGAIHSASTYLKLFARLRSALSSVRCSFFRAAASI